MILRQDYLKKLIDFKDKNLIKVITGIRRCGKSVLMGQFKAHLIEIGIDEGQIIHLNFESLKYEHLKNYASLYAYIMEQAGDRGRVYILLDEIQEVDGWEKTLSSLQVDLDCDLYITGSNAKLLSSELATYISGRYVEIHMLPLSFKEVAANHADEPMQQSFNRFTRYGGFPGLTEMGDNEALARDYLIGIYNTIIVKDVISRNNFRDVDLINLIVKFVTDNIGNLMSATKIADYLTSSGRKTHASTVNDYLQALENAFAIYKVDRYSIKGKQLLKAPYKYYVADLGLRGTALGFREMDLGRVIENVVFLELVRRGYHVFVGADQSFEVDFIAEKGQERIYYQVSLSIVDDNVKRREVGGLLKIPDNFPKVLITMDYHAGETDSGIELVNLLDFLLGN